MTSELHALADAVLLAGFTGPTLPGALRDRLAAGLGGLTLFATNIGPPEQVRALTAQIHAANPDAVIAVDEEGGDVTRLQWRSGSSYPGNLALGMVDDVALSERVGAAIGGDLARAGVDLNLAPSVDVNCEPRNPVIGVRSFGADAERVGAHAAAWIRGHQSRGVAACAKHFPGHGATTADSHHDLPRLEVGRALLDARELAPFRAAIAAGTRAVLTAHLVVPALDDVPATISRTVLTDLLRGELGFDGVVVSDALDMAAIAGSFGRRSGAVRALAAGVDALCLGTDHHGLADVDQVRDAVVEAVRSGALAESRVREAGDRMRALARWSARSRR
ncbi:MAG: glycoside hydrolase family 3 protein, partial [Kineosporiaceae bacterium]